MSNNQSPGSANLLPDNFFADARLQPIEPWPSPVEGHVLLDNLVRDLQRFVVFPKWAAETPGPLDFA